MGIGRIKLLGYRVSRSTVHGRLTNHATDGSDKEELEFEANSFSVRDYHNIEENCPLARAIKKAYTTPHQPEPEPRRLHNQFQGTRYGWQLGESAADFVKRLPPSTTRIQDIGEGFLWAVNPYLEPPQERRDVAGFKDAGEELLAEFKTQRLKLEADAKENKSRDTAALNKAVDELRAQTEKKILKSAREHNVKHGKWLLFELPEDLDPLWRTVVEETIEGMLGPASKVAVAVDEGTRVSRLICVYTADFDDKKDVRRVLDRLLYKETFKRRRGIWYKCGKFGTLEV